MRYYRAWWAWRKRRPQPGQFRNCSFPKHDFRVALNRWRAQRPDWEDYYGRWG